MSAKSEQRSLLSINSRIQRVRKRQPPSLRLRLMLWYGVLVAVALGVFACLVLTLTAKELNENVENSLSVQTDAIALNVRQELSATTPYWPAHLSSSDSDIYHGSIIEILDRQGMVRYQTKMSKGCIPIESSITHATYAGRTGLYTVDVNGVEMRVEAVPLYAPRTAARTTSPPGSAIGILLVARSLKSMNTTLSLLQTMLLISGSLVLMGALGSGWFIAASALHPLAEVVKTARAIAADTERGTYSDTLSHRVPRSKGKGYDEMAQVITTFNDMLASLERATRAQRHFVADASHELRAPMTTIQGNLTFLEHRVDMLSPGERSTVLRDSCEEMQRLAQLVDDLLLLARNDAHVETSLMVQRKTIVEVDLVLLRLLRQLRGRLSTEESKPMLEIGHIESARVLGDEESLRRVMLILLDNAFKYRRFSNSRSTESVFVSLERQGQEAVLKIRDTGIGIDATDLPHIFERFYRAGRVRSHQGTGLGLAIAQKLVTQLSGRITVESTLGKGSTFAVWLPLA